MCNSLLKDAPLLLPELVNEDILVDFILTWLFFLVAKTEVL